MKVAAFYRFLDVDDPAGLRDALQSLCEQRALLGTILVANEGVNGTVAGSETAINTIFAWLGERLALREPLEARWTAPVGRWNRRQKLPTLE